MPLPLFLFERKIRVRRGVPLLPLCPNSIYHSFLGREKKKKGGGGGTFQGRLKQVDGRHCLIPFYRKRKGKKRRKKGGDRPPGHPLYKTIRRSFQCSTFSRKKGEKKKGGGVNGKTKNPPEGRAENFH